MMLLIQTDEQSWFYLDRCAKKQKAPFERDTRTGLFCFLSAKAQIFYLKLVQFNADFGRDKPGCQNSNQMSK